MDDSVVKKLIKSKSGFRMVTTNGEHMSPFFIEEPNWAPDKETSHCTGCSVKFGFTTRKHHCRRCGLIFCSKCCETKLELPRMCFIDPVRVCINCETQTRLETKFFQHDIKILLNGAIFLMRQDTIDGLLLFCKLSQDHRYLVFEGTDIDSIDLCEITSVNIEADKRSGKTSLEIVYALEGSKSKITFDTTKNPLEKRIGNNWIKAIKHAFNFLNEQGLNDSHDFIK